VAAVPPDRAADEQLHAWVRADFGVVLVTSSPVLHGIDEAAQLWRGSADDGATYAVKLTSGGTAAGLVVPAHLAAHGVAGAPAPARSLDGRLWTEHDGRRLSLVPWLSDRRAPGAMTREHWLAMGELLAATHAAPLHDELEAVVPRERYDHSRAVRVVRDLTRRLDRVAGDDITVGLATEWDMHRDRIAALLALADAWDGMVSHRVYSPPRAIADALEECRELVGRQFTAEAVDAREALHEHGDLAMAAVRMHRPTPEPVQAA